MSTNHQLVCLERVVVPVLPVEARLRKTRDFQRVYRARQARTSEHLRLLWTRGLPGRNRVGFVVGKAVGGAVRRNRVKRLLRESWWRNLAGLEGGYDVVVQVKRERGREMSGASWQQVERELTNLIRRAGINRGPGGGGSGTGGK